MNGIAISSMWEAFVMSIRLVMMKTDKLLEAEKRVGKR